MINHIFKCDELMINKIIKLKDNRYKIYIDGDSIITYDNVILENDLLYKKNIDKNLYNKIIVDTNYYDIYNKTVKYILKKLRSEKEVSNYLSKFELSDKDFNKMINKLKDINLINDREFCKAFINDKIYLGKNGINKIRNDLLNQYISNDIIEQELSNIDKSVVNDKLEKLIVKKINSNHKYSNSYLKHKILNDMVSLGYSKENIIEIIDKNLVSDDEIVRKEFDKVYVNLNRKYSGAELNLKLKQRLISKGFKIDVINELIQEKIGC